MGGPLQEVLQGGGGKTGKGIGIKRLLPFSLLFLSWLSFVFEVPLKWPLVWFTVSLSTTLLYSFIAFVKKDINNSLELLFSFSLLIAGGIQFSQYRWLHLLYFPYLIALLRFYPPVTVISLSLATPALEIRHILNSSFFTEEVSLTLVLIMSVAVAAGITSRIRKQRDFIELPVQGLQEEPSGRINNPDAESIGDDRLISHYLSSMFKADEEIKEVLEAAKKTLLADSANLFLLQDNALKVRCSTDELSNIIFSREGFLSLCIREKRPVISSSISKNGYEIGYIKKGRISSFIAVPVIDRNFVLGVLSCDSLRFHAFSNQDAEALQIFAGQVSRVLQRERVYPQIHRAYSGLRVLHEESAKLVTSLKLDMLAGKIIESAYRIAPASVAFFMNSGDNFELCSQKGMEPQEAKVFSFKNTLLNMAVKNKENLYISDVRQYRIPIMPFKAGEIGSVLILPMTYEEKGLLGMLVLLSEKTGAFNSYQIELLEVLCNQASVSLANARLHSEIEKIAVTDGLTGLFNHRHFQETLTNEFKRIERYSEPLSLLIMDIDYFKKINDTYGHPAGDKVLKGVSGIVKDTIRSIDLPARYGGEEFAALLVNTDTQGAQNIAERLRKTIMNTKFHADEAVLNVTVSIGISTCPLHAKKKEDLIDKADKALYYAKKNGRNQCVLWNEGL